MPTFRVVCPVFCLVLFLTAHLSASAPPPPPEVYTIQLTSGETLEDVSAKFDQQFKVARLEDGRVISFADITAIHHDGIDVTQAILGRSIRDTHSVSPETAPQEDAPRSTTEPDEEPWLSESSEAYRAARRR